MTSFEVEIHRGEDGMFGLDIVDIDPWVVDKVKEGSPVHLDGKLQVGDRVMCVCLAFNLPRPALAAWNSLPPQFA